MAASEDQAESEGNAASFADKVADTLTDKVTNSATTEPLPIPGLPADWHLLATDKIVKTVDQVKVKTAGPAIGVARSAVFGILAALLGIIAVPLFLIGIVRLLNEYIPAGVWLVYMILGTIFLAVGVLLWSKRPRGATS